jgi:enterochelin esterase-like enzyme
VARVAAARAGGQEKEITEAHMKLFITICIAFRGTIVPYAADISAADDRQPQPGIPQGKITSGVFEKSEIFPGTRRDYSVYAPAQYTPDKPACLMVFMDGANYAKADGPYRVPIVFDNLIHQKVMPVTIAVFVNPGTIVPTKPGAAARSNRSFEYDSLGDRYARFVLEEFLPVATKGLNVSSDPKQRAVCGASSGGICAFTVAWERPDQFGKVLSHIGSFTDIRGGWAYPGLIRKTRGSPKPIKVYLQDGKDDLNNLFGNWPLANEDMAAALKFAGYEHQLVMTDGGHSGNWAGPELPAALRWLWSDQLQ